MPSFDDLSRVGYLQTAGGAKLYLRRVLGTDYINDLFEYRVEAISEDANLALETMLGKEGDVAIRTYSGEDRYFRGHIFEAAWLGTDNQGHIYSFTIRPSVYAATQQENQRIFKQMSPTEIIKKVLNDYEATIEVKNVSNDPTLEYCVQYRESDWDFCCRLMEKYGINFFFEHGSSQLKLILCGDNDGFVELSGAEREFIPVDTANIMNDERFWEWCPGRMHTTGKVKLQDFNYNSPNAAMTAEGEGEATHTWAKRETYEYPGGYDTKGDGTKVAKLRAEQFRSADHHHIAKGDVLSLSAGLRFKLTGEHDAKVTGKKYICLRATHSFINNAYSSGSGSPTTYTASFEMYEMDSKFPYRPERKTKPAIVEGPQTATVVGAKGEEIDVDEMGRILVHFHWDIEKQYSIRVRCAQLWAHNKWGAMFIPRVGMEVVVVFVEGDPDKPLVVGCVYNGANKVPWSLPADKNIGGIKSRSTKSGGNDNYNELYFDDTKGKELFNQQAERDMKTLVKRNERRQVDVDRATYIGQDETREVGRDEKHEIKRDQEYKVERDQTYEVKRDVDWTIDGKEDREVKKSRTTDIKMKDTLDVGQTLTMKAGQKIELKCGGSKIVMTPSGIEIKSVKIDIKASAQLNTQGGIVNHKATGVMKIKGAMVMIN